MTTNFNVGVGWMGGWSLSDYSPLRGLSCKQRLARFSAELKTFKIECGNYKGIFSSKVEHEIDKSVE